MIDSDYRECIPNLIFDGYGDYGIEKIFHISLVVILSSIVLSLRIKSSDEINNKIAFGMTIFISFLISYFIFYTNWWGKYISIDILKWIFDDDPSSLYDYWHNGTSFYDHINVAFNYDSPPNPDTDNTERHTYYWFISLLIIVPITSFITFLIQIKFL